MYICIQKESSTAYACRVSLPTIPLSRCPKMRSNRGPAPSALDIKHDHIWDNTKTHVYRMQTSIIHSSAPASAKARAKFEGSSMGHFLYTTTFSATPFRLRKFIPRAARPRPRPLPRPFISAARVVAASRRTCRISTIGITT